MKANFNYTLENGVGMKVEVEPTGKTSPEFKAKATILKPELFEESKGDALDMVMATGMKQVMEMMSWEEMWEVETTNFELGKAPMGEGSNGEDELGLGMLFKGMGPMGEA